MGGIGGYLLYTRSLGGKLHQVGEFESSSSTRRLSSSSSSSRSSSSSSTRRLGGKLHQVGEFERQTPLGGAADSTIKCPRPIFPAGPQISS